MGRQEMVEKRGLEDAALAYENHDRLVGDIGPHPANHHVDQPFPEGIGKILLRMAVTACLHHGYPMGQFSDIVSLSVISADSSDIPPWG